MFHYWTQTVDSLASAVLISFTLSYSVLHSDVPTYVCTGVLKYEEHQTAFKLFASIYMQCAYTEHPRTPQ